jgi:hypothetical protein
MAPGRTCVDPCFLINPPAPAQWTQLRQVSVVADHIRLYPLALHQSQSLQGHLPGFTYVKLEELTLEPLHKKNGRWTANSRIFDGIWLTNLIWSIWIIWVCLIIRDLSRITVIAIWWEKILETMFFRRYPIFRQTYVILRLAVRHFTNEVMLLAGSKKRSNELPNHPILSHSPNIISGWW